MLRTLLAVSALCVTVAAMAQPDATKATLSAEKAAGHYRFASGQILTLELFGEKLTAKSRAMPQSVLTKNADGRFMYPSGSAYLSFGIDSNGVPNALTYHEQDRTYPATRIDDAAFKSDTEAWDLKIKDQTPSPDCAPSVKNLIEGIRSGQPDYSKLAPIAARAVSAQLPAVQPWFEKAGAAQEVKFLSVDANGNDIFDVTFESGLVTKWRVQCLKDGHLGILAFRT